VTFNTTSVLKASSHPQGYFHRYGSDFTDDSARRSASDSLCI